MSFAYKPRNLLIRSCDQVYFCNCKWHPHTTSQRLKEHTWCSFSKMYHLFSIVLSSFPRLIRWVYNQVVMFYPKE